MSSSASQSREIRVVFQASFPYVLTSTLSLVGMAPFYEGLDSWIDATYAALDPEFRLDIHHFFFPLVGRLLIAQLVAERPQLVDFAAFVAWLAALDKEAIREAVRGLIEDLRADEQAAGFEATFRHDDVEEMTDFLRHVVCKDWNSDRTALLLDPGALRTRLTLGVIRFWEAHFREEYARCSVHIARCVERKRVESFPGSFEEVVSAVTGRPVQESAIRRYGGAEELIFVPSCYTGPYVNFASVGHEGRQVLITFNAKYAEGTEHGDLLPVRELFVPLKALADETRLEILKMLKGEELYAQQIVDQLEISQPSVSRHLRLMVASGILTERRDEKMKYYRIHEETLASLAWNFSAFLGAGERWRRQAVGPEVCGQEYE